MSRETTKQVRQIVGKYYEAYQTFNDLRKDKKTRRIKFMRNGFRFEDSEYKAWAAAIKKDLDEAGIWYRDAGFDIGESWRGDYVYYSIVIEA
jgi:hypothetical protein